MLSDRTNRWLDVTESPLGLLGFMISPVAVVATLASGIAWLRGDPVSDAFDWVGPGVLLLVAGTLLVGAFRGAHALLDWHRDQSTVRWEHGNRDVVAAYAPMAGAYWVREAVRLGLKPGGAPYLPTAHQPDWLSEQVLLMRSAQRIGLTDVRTVGLWFQAGLLPDHAHNSRWATAGQRISKQWLAVLGPDAWMYRAIGMTLPEVVSAKTSGQAGAVRMLAALRGTL